jgi:hypothetical protein
MTLNLDTITHVCICGSRVWNTWVVFDDYEIAAYGLDITCALCGATAIAPTELDRDA